MYFRCSYQGAATKDGLDTHANNMRTGKKMSVKSHNVKQRVPAHRTYSVSMRPRTRRYSPEDIKARLILFIGVTLSLVFLVVTFGIVYALIFVTQPIGAQAPNDAAFIDLLKTLAIFLTGSLGGVLASNGLKDKSNEAENKKHQDLPNSQIA